MWLKAQRQWGRIWTFLEIKSENFRTQNENNLRDVLFWVLHCTFENQSPGKLNDFLKTTQLDSGRNKSRCQSSSIFIYESFLFVYWRGTVKLQAVPSSHCTSRPYFIPIFSRPDPSPLSCIIKPLGYLSESPGPHAASAKCVPNWSFQTHALGWSRAQSQKAMKWDSPRSKKVESLDEPHWNPAADLLRLTRSTMVCRCQW